MTFTIGGGAKNWLRTFWTFLIAVLLAGIQLLLQRFFKPMDWIWIAGATLWLAGFFWYCPAYCRSLKGQIDVTAVRVEQGVWWHRHTLVPLSSLRTFEVWALPLHRLFRCRTVVLRFAGGSTRLPLLDESTATRLTALLEKQGELS